MPEWTVIEDEWPSAWRPVNPRPYRVNSVLPGVLIDDPAYAPYLLTIGCNCDACLRLRMEQYISQVRPAQTRLMTWNQEPVEYRAAFQRAQSDTIDQMEAMQKMLAKIPTPETEAKPEGWTWYQKLSRAISKIRVAYHASI